MHVTDGRAGSNILYGLKTTLVHGVTRMETLNVINECEIRQAKRTLVTRPILRLFESYFAPGRCHVEIIGFRYYSEVSDDHKWMHVTIDTSTKSIWNIPLLKKAGCGVVPEIRKLFMMNGHL